MIHDPQELHRVTDLLNEVLEQAEQSLRDLNLGVEASVRLEKSSDGKPRDLAFLKQGKEFQLMMVVHEGQETHVHRLISTSRHTRINAVKFLESLRSALFDAYKTECRRVKDAVSRANEFTVATRQIRQEREP